MANETLKTYCLVTNRFGTQIQYYFVGVSSVQVQKNATITDYPTQEGTQFSDYKYRELQSITIQFNINGLIKTGVYSLTGDNYEYLSKDDIKDLFDSWYEDNTFITIKTREEEFTNYVVSGISWAEDDNNMGSWKPSVTFREVRVAEIEEIEFEFPETNQDSAANSSSTENGDNNGNSVTYDTSEATASILGGAGAGATVGAIVGSIIPIPGATLVGAAIGGLGGMLINAGKSFGWW